MKATLGAIVYMGEAEAGAICPKGIVNEYVFLSFPLISFCW